MISSKEISITITGSPIKQGRPRFARVGSFTKAYDPNKKQKDLVITQLKEKYMGSILDVPLEVELVFYMQIPKSTSKKNKSLMETNLIKHTKLGDVDNLAKFILDCMNNVIYTDDRLIWKLTAVKRYGEVERTEIMVSS